MIRWLGLVVAAALVGPGCGPAVPDADHAGGPGLAAAGGGGPGGDTGPAGRVPPGVTEAIDAERARLADADQAIEAARATAEASDDATALEALLALEHDRAVRARFLAHLERCAAGEETCPPALTEPTVPKEYDPSEGELEGVFAADPTLWPSRARELAAAACACRTRDCIGWVAAELERWETGLSPADADADDAATSVTAARACIWDRLGK